MMFITGKMISTIRFFNQEQFQFFQGHNPRKRSYTDLVKFPVSQLCVTKTCNNEIVQSCVTLPFLFLGITPSLTPA